MPLVTCPDCGGPVSSDAAQCPKCGRPNRVVPPPAFPAVTIPAQAAFMPLAAAPAYSREYVAAIEKYRAAGYRQSAPGSNDIFGPGVTTLSRPAVFWHFWLGILTCFSLVGFVLYRVWYVFSASTDRLRVQLVPRPDGGVNEIGDTLAVYGYRRLKGERQIQLASSIALAVLAALLAMYALDITLGYQPPHGDAAGSLIFAVVVAGLLALWAFYLIRRARASGRLIRSYEAQAGLGKF